MSGSIPNTTKTLFSQNRTGVHTTTGTQPPINRQNTAAFRLSYFHTFVLSCFPAFILRRSRSGFTLIEVIVTIIISAVLATILAQVMANQTSRSYLPVRTIEENLALRAAMDNIASDYRWLKANDASPLVTLQTRIQTAGTYWNTSSTFTNGVSLQASSSCIGFDANNDEDPSLENTTCDATDTTLSVTLSVTGTRHCLTTLFTR